MKYFCYLICLFYLVSSCRRDEQLSDELIVDPPIITHININIENQEKEISKKNYIDSTIFIDGKNQYENFTGITEIRGRGNTSWDYPKKPYRIKLEKESNLFGLAPYKSWILLAEYLDGSMLYNSIPFEMAKLLGIPYTNHIIPVELTINDKYRGIYAFTEHKEVGPNRIDIGENGLLLELDSYFDEDWKFKSTHFDLPIMVAHPEDLNTEKLSQIKMEFEEFEALVADSHFPNNQYLNYFDDESFVNYMLIYKLTQNREINHPKSVYINKLPEGKYRMGIIWDFDWAFGYSYSEQHYDINNVYRSIFVDNSMPGKDFFSKIMTDPHMQNLFKQKWTEFKVLHFANLKNHIRSYAQLIEQGIEADHEIWGKRDSSGNIKTDLQNVLEWLDARADYIDEYVNSF